jgi:hypothetical protein
MTALSFPGTSDAYAQNVIGTFTSTTAGYVIIRVDDELPANYLIGRVNLAEDDDVWADADVDNTAAGGLYIVLPITGADDWRIYAYESGVYDAGLTGTGTFTVLDGECLVHEGPIDNPDDDYVLGGPYVSGTLVVLMDDVPLVEAAAGGGWDEDDPDAGSLTIIESHGGGDMFDFYYLDPECVNPTTPGLFAEFDGEWEELPVIDWRITRGVSGDLAGNSSPGSATFTIQNPDDRYNPENAGSPLYGLLTDGVRMWCGVNDDGTLVDGGTVKGLFAGLITDIEPLPVSGPADSPTVVITCADPLEWMGRQPVRLPDSRTRSQASLRAEVLAEVWPYATDLPAEPTTLPLSAADGLAGNVLDELNRASGTRHYIKPADTRTAWATYTAVRRTSLLDAVSLASFDAGTDHVTTAGWRRSADGVINQQKASIEPIAFTALRDVWEAETLPTVLTGTPYEVWAEFADFVDAPLVDESHTGSSLTTAIEPFGKTAKVTLTSSGTSVLTHLSVQGYAVIRGPAAGYVKDDTASQAANGRGVRAGPDISGDLAGTLTAATGLANHVVYRFAEPLGRPTLTLVNWLPDQFERDLLQLIDVTVAELKVTARVFEIVGLTHTGELAAPTAVSHTVEYVLQESREQTDPGWFRIGSSLLGGTDILAY